MFAALVKDTLEDFEKLPEGSTGQMGGDLAKFDPFGEEWSVSLVEFIYSHFEGMKLLVCCSMGSRFASFEEDLIEREMRSNQCYAKVLKEAAYAVQSLTQMQWHLLSTEYIHLVLEMVRHDLPREEADRHMEFVRMLLYPGWKKNFGMQDV